MPESGHHIIMVQDSCLWLRTEEDMSSLFRLHRLFAAHLSAERTNPSCGERARQTYMCTTCGWAPWSSSSSEVIVFTQLRRAAAVHVVENLSVTSKDRCELNRNDSITRTRRCKSCQDPSGWRWSLTLRAAIQFSLPSTPLSPHSPHSNNSTSSTSGNSTSPTLSGTNVRCIHRYSKELPPIGCYRPLSSSFVPIATHQPAVCVSPRCLVFHSRSSSRPPWWPAGITSSGVSTRPLTADYRRERLPLGTSTAERPPGAAFLKICVRTLLLLLYFSAYRGWPLLDNERTPVVTISFGHASKLIYEE